MFGEKKTNDPNNYGYSGQMMHEVPMNFQWNQQLMYRNQMNPYQSPPQNYDWHPYQQQGFYYPQPFQPYGDQNYQQGYGPQNMSQSKQPYPQKDSNFLFQNPLQPKDEMIQPQYMPPMNGYPMMNPYPKQSVMPKQSGGMQTFMNSFKSQDGSVDFNKMMNTAGQMMTAVNQVSSLVKGFGGIFKA